MAATPKAQKMLILVVYEAVDAIDLTNEYRNEAKAYILDIEDDGISRAEGLQWDNLCHAWPHC